MPPVGFVDVSRAAEVPALAVESIHQTASKMRASQKLTLNLNDFKSLGGGASERTNDGLYGALPVFAARRPAIAHGNNQAE
jgi:hypothetical protein